MSQCEKLNKLRITSQATTRDGVENFESLVVKLNLENREACGKYELVRNHAGTMTIQILQGGFFVHAGITSE